MVWWWSLDSGWEESSGDYQSMIEWLVEMGGDADKWRGSSQLFTIWTGKLSQVGTEWYYGRLRNAPRPLVNLILRLNAESSVASNRVTLISTSVIDSAFSHASLPTNRGTAERRIHIEGNDLIQEYIASISLFEWWLLCSFVLHHLIIYRGSAVSESMVSHHHHGHTTYTHQKVCKFCRISDNIQLLGPQLIHSICHHLLRRGSRPFAFSSLYPVAHGWARNISYIAPMITFASWWSSGSHLLSMRLFEILVAVESLLLQPFIVTLLPNIDKISIFNQWLSTLASGIWRRKAFWERDRNC